MEKLAEFELTEGEEKKIQRLLDETSCKSRIVDGQDGKIMQVFGDDSCKQVLRRAKLV